MTEPEAKAALKNCLIEALKVYVMNPIAFDDKFDILVDELYAKLVVTKPE